MTMSMTDDSLFEPQSWPEGFRLFRRAPGPDAALLEAYRRFPVCQVGDAMGRHTGARGLIAYHRTPQTRLCGPAFTVKVRPGDNMMIHIALMLAQPGDILVIDGGADLTTALIGGLMRTTAIARKLGGIIIDGALRDVNDWADGRIAVFARGHVLCGPSKEGPGEINVPIACAGLAIAPGDLVMGDADGVLALSPAQAKALLPRCEAIAAREERVMRQNATGEIDRERMADMLSRKGFKL